MRCQCRRAAGHHLRCDNRQQPDAGQGLQHMLLAGKHQVRHAQRHTDGQHQRQPPQAVGQRHDGRALHRHSKQQQAVDHLHQPHGNRTEEHRLHRVIEHRPQGVAKQQQARGKQQTEQAKQQRGQPPQAFGQQHLPGERQRQPGHHLGQHAGAHGHGKPVGGELTHEGQRLMQTGKGAQHHGIPHRQSPMAIHDWEVRQSRAIGKIHIKDTRHTFYL